MKIKKIEAFSIFDSRGIPTIEVELTLDNGVQGHGLVPSGASTGQFEALELRDGIPDLFGGKSVNKAIQNVNGEINATLIGQDIFDQQRIDETLIKLDNTANKSRLGANAILGVSMAAAKAAAATKKQALFEYLGNGTLLPLPEIQIIGGGAHANWRTDIQDFLIIANGAKSYKEALEITFNVYQTGAKMLKERGTFYGLADEGGFWPAFESNEAVLVFLVDAISKAGYRPGEEVSISLDIAASDLYNEENEIYSFSLEKQNFSKSEFADLLISWCAKYPILSIEDPAADTDWNGWNKLMDKLGHKVQIIGDDLFTTNINRIKKGIDLQAANSVLIKLNQVGTVTETLEAIQLTKNAGWLAVISARSGETEDAFISHLAVATNAGQLKVGSFARSERMVKWNECLRIERKLGKRAEFMGAGIYERIFI